MSDSKLGRALTLRSVLFCLLVTAAAPLRTLADPVAYEPFAAYEYDQNIASSGQPNPPTSTGVLDYTAGNTILTHHVRQESLSFGTLQREGGKLELNTGGVGLNAALDLSPTGPFADYLEAGKVGKDGTTLYLSLMLQLGNTETAAQSFMALSESGTQRLTIGHTWGQSTFAAGSQLTGHPLDTDVHFVVIRIDYQAGNDAITVWLDPDLSADETQTATNTHTRNATFDSFFFQGQNAPLFLDEIRFGTTWSDVTPIAISAYTLNATAGSDGSLHQDPVKAIYLDGDEVYLEAIADHGFRFSGWSGDVPAGSETTNPLRLQMDQDRNLQANFVPGKTAFFNLAGTPDSYAPGALLDLRSLNETRAGESGFVTRSGDQLLLGDGSPARFWAATTGTPADTEMDPMLRFLSKRGVNLVRWHTSLYSNSAPTLASVRDSRIDDAQRLVIRAREEGIYTKLSFFFILGLRIQESWNIDGYTSAWLSANSGGYADQAPFALQFFDEDFKAAYKNWLTQLLTRPNPYDEDNTPLGQEPAVAMLELQNEDNLFFWTFVPDRFPPEQQAKLFGLFGDFLTEKYGSIADAQSAWGWTASQANNSRYAADDTANGQVAVLPAFYMTGGFTGAVPEQARIKDQILFLINLQREWYAEMQDHVRTTIGSPILTTASNWTTADNEFLLDAEAYTYTAADILDKHHYFSPQINNTVENVNVSGGDTYYSAPGMTNPRTLPTVYKHVADMPAILSESTWVNPHDDKAEAALLVAAYGALSGLDGFVWFATDDPGWQDGRNRWEFASPALAGAFPAAALIYRQGYVTEADAVIREGHTPDSIASKERSLFFETRGWDATRDPSGTLTTDPSDGSGAALDTLAALVGRVEVDFSTDTDSVSPSLSDLIDYEARTVASSTGELLLHWGTPPNVEPPNPVDPAGWFTINTPSAQAATGYLAAAGTRQLDNVDISMANAFGSVAVVALDGKPLSESTQILIQANARENLRRALREDVVLTENGTDYLGKRILEIGELPWQMEGIDASVTLKGAGLIQSVQSLDENGYPLRSLSVPTARGTHQTIELPADALYTLITLNPAQSSYQAWPAFTPEEHDDPTISGPTANPDQDAFNNLLEYALLLEPKVAEGQPGYSVSPIEFSYKFRYNDSQLNRRVEVSQDLSTWHYNDDGSGLTYTQSIQLTENPDGSATEQIQLHPDAGWDTDRLFYRIRFELEP